MCGRGKYQDWEREREGENLFLLGSFTNKFASYSSELSQATATAAAACQLKIIAICCQRTVPRPWQFAKRERERETERVE